MIGATVLLGLSVLGSLLVVTWHLDEFKKELLEIRKLLEEHNETHRV